MFWEREYLKVVRGDKYMSEVFPSERMHCYVCEWSSWGRLRSAFGEECYSSAAIADALLFSGVLLDPRTVRRAAAGYVVDASALGCGRRYFVRSSGLDAVARRCGLLPEQLEETVRAFVLDDVVREEKEKEEVAAQSSL